MESGNWKAEAALGAVVVGVIVAFVWLTFSFGGGAPRDARPYVLLFDSALGLGVDNTVAVAGVRVGVVDDIRVEGKRARVTVLVAPDVVLHTDARAAVRQKTLLGEKFVDLDPGSADAVLTAGAVVDNNAPTIDIDQVIRATSELIDRFNRITPPLESAVQSLDEALKEKDGAALIAAATTTLHDVRALVKQTNALVSNSSGDVASVLAMANEKGPGLVDRLNNAAARIDAILAVVDPASIKAAADMVGPAADNIDRITRDAKVAMGDVREAAKRLDGVLARVDSALAKLDGVDEELVREFLQIQGVRVNLLPDATVTNRIKKLRDEATPLPEETPAPLPAP